MQMRGVWRATGQRMGPAPAVQERGLCRKRGGARLCGPPVVRDAQWDSQAPPLPERGSGLATPHVYTAGRPGDGDQVSAADRGAQDVGRRRTMLRLNVGTSA